MGCGASAHAQGSSPLRPGAEQSSLGQEGRNNKPSPIAEDVRTVQDQGSKEVGPPSAGASPPDNSVSDSQQPAGSVKPGGAPGVQLESNVGSAAPLAGDGQPALDQQQQPQSQQPSQQASGRLLLGDASSTTDLDRRSPATPGLASSISGLGGGPLVDPAVTPNSGTATVTLLPDAVPGGFVPRPRYTNESDLAMASASYDLSGQAADSDSDNELEALFTMASWKRFYNYNKRKPKDLLNYFWRRFPPLEFSVFCICYRNQDLLITQYMADNLVNGYFARLEDMGLSDTVFLQMYVLHDYDADLYRIVGLLITAGQAVPPPLASLSAFDGFIYQRADLSLMPVKKFVSALLVGWSPLNSLELMHSREIT